MARIISIGPLILKIVEGHGLLGILDGSDPMPVVSKSTDKDKDSTSANVKQVDENTIATWHQKNAKVITRILDSIDPSISLSLQAFTKASEMWNHLKKLYHQTSKARRFSLDAEIAKYCQGDKKVL